jgi:nucleotide-binding universal stress UspA family protein
MNSFPNKILLATDGSEDATLAARAAIELSNRTASELHVVHVWHDVPTPHFRSFVRAQLRQEAHETLQKQLERIEQTGGTVAKAHLREGRTIDEILGLSEELEVGLLIVGSRGLGGVKRILLGSVSEGIIHHSRRPVLVMRGGENAWPPSRVIIGDDSSEDAREAAQLAARIGKLFGATALMVRAYPRLPETDPEGRELDPRMVENALRREQRTLEGRAAEIEEASGIRPRAKIAVGDPAASLIEAAEEAAPERALIAVGSRGLDVVQRLRLGSVSTKVLRASGGPVLVVNPGPRERRIAHERPSAQPLTSPAPDSNIHTV